MGGSGESALRILMKVSIRDKPLETQSNPAEYFKIASNYHVERCI